MRRSAPSSLPRLRVLLETALLFCLAASVRAQDVARIDEEKPITVSGFLNAQGQHYTSSLGNTTGRPDVTGTVSLSALVSVYGVQLPFSLQLTSSEATFRQPFNEFGLSPRYKGITGHFGYRSIRLSQYSLSYQRWLGAGAEVRVGNIRLSMMYGRFQKATDEDSARRAPAIYKRMGYGVLVGYGSSANYVDLSLFKAWDDSGSVPIAKDFSLRPLPAENAVLAASTRFTLLENKLTVDAELAGSAYTRDLGAPEEQVSNVPSVVSGLIRVRTSTRANYAMRAAVTLALKRYRVALRYERVGPNFSSMGVGYISADREDITIAPMAAPFSFVRLTASIGVRRNNLAGDKLTTAHRLIASLGTSWTISNDLGFDLRYANYSTSSSDGLRRVTDTTRIENVSSMISGGPRFTFGSEDMRQSLALYLSHQKYDDRNVVSGALNNNSAFGATVSYGSTIDEYNLNGSLSYADSKSPTYSTATTQLSAGASRTFAENKLSLSVTLSYGIARGASGTDAQFLPALSATYMLSERDIFLFSTQLNQNARTNLPYTEVVTSLGYSRTF